MPPIKNYGHLSRQNQKTGQAWKWAVIGGVFTWGLAVFTWSAQRIAALFGYHPGLGEPVFEAGGRLWYWPWKFLEWASQYQQYEEVSKIVDQAYLACVGVPMVLFLVYMASQQGLKGREDLHGSAKWAVNKDIEAMGYLKGEGVYVGGWWDSKKKIHYYLRHNGPEHVLCFAPTRSGKGVGLILPTLLSWPHSSVVLDIKGENFVRP